MISGLKLIEPDIRYKDSFIEALREGLYTHSVSARDIKLAEKDFSKYIKKCRDSNRVAQMDLWLVSEDTFLATSSLRSDLDKSLERQGGHISYAVRKTARRKGYGHVILKKTLDRAKDLGLKKVLVTCHDKNIGSIRLIEKSGGVFEDTIKFLGFFKPERRYWINL